MSARAVNPPRRWRSPLFLAAAGFLVVSAIALKPALGLLAQRFSKQPIAIRKSLHDFDAARLPSFRSDPARSGTAIPWGDLDTEEWLYIPLEPRESPQGPGLIIHATYYSSAREVIEHTPEICYRAGGATVRASREMVVDVPGLAPDETAIDVRLLEIDMRGAPMVVMYTLCHNGRFYNDREQVRVAVGLPGDRYTYVAKFEVAMPLPRRALDAASIEQCARAFREALPILVDEHFPRREQLKAES